MGEYEHITRRRASLDAVKELEKFRMRFVRMLKSLDAKGMEGLCRAVHVPPEEFEAEKTAMLTALATFEPQRPIPDITEAAAG